MKNIIKAILKITIISQLSFLSIGALASQTSDKIKIDIISDVVCPWCAIGYKRLSLAIDELGIKDKVEIQWHPFELNPNMPREGQNANKYLMNKLGLNKDALIKKRESVTTLGEKSGFKFNYFEEMKKVNTLNAHILLDYAKEFNKQTQLKVRLQEAYFGEKKDISNRNVLAKEVEKVGLNVGEAMARLDSKEAIKSIKDQEKYWRDQGASAIPIMIFNNNVVRAGANKVYEYKQLLTKLLLKN
ncbi:DsbA family oxidoreductase [Poseidonibacter ostreae]|uniref:DsbA family oxidoreductase n=1 Tax=Poseidonibacter ostreae TaxID=2654171 RepID=A0A6L4WXQ1_9BACT|nr:DsbA family oxidoreductase [Poseidonibacter ostreae]KAB7888936.1 DsbA family oxidoreductase [Poseidonibacter ostreae]KAB7890318.1 DsbA family oxidoreductase [Poseidonibacter ostreae]